MLLTDEELKLYHCGIHDEWYSQNCSNCMIDSNEPDIIAKTLKAVAEWLGEVCQNEGHPDYQTTRIYCDYCLAELIDCGERGKMPGEEK